MKDRPSSPGLLAEALAVNRSVPMDPAALSAWMPVNRMRSGNARNLCHSRLRKH